MKRVQFTLLGFVFCALITFSACIKDNSGLATGAYTKGIFIVNEGLPSSQGTISFLKRDSGTIANDIFSAANGGAKVGGVINSINYWLNFVYIMSATPGKMDIVDPYTFRLTQTIADTNFVNPQFFAGIASYSVGGTIVNKAYITDFGPGDSSGRVQIYSLDANQVTGYIPTGYGTKQLLQLSSGVMLALNSGIPGTPNWADSTVAVIDIVADTVIKNYIVGVNPNSMVQDANNDIWVLGSKSSNPNLGGVLSRIHGGNVDINFSVPAGSAHLAVDSTAHYLYFAGGDNKLYVKDIINFGANAPTLFTVPGLSLTSPYGIGFDYSTGYMLLTDAKDKNTPGTLYVIDTRQKKIIYTVPVGINPGSFLYE